MPSVGQKLRASFDTVEKREQWAWCMYDWANGAYIISVSAVFAGPFITGLTKETACNSADACTWCSVAASCLSTVNASQCGANYTCEHSTGWCCEAPGELAIGGIDIGYGSFYAFVVAAGVILQVFMLPILAAIADHSGNTKQMFMVSTYASALFVILMVFINSPNLWWLGGLFLCMAELFFGASCVFYDSFLNMIAPEEERTSLSSKGYGIGYIGGGIYLAVNLVLYSMYESDLTIRLIIAGAGIWWVVFSGITFTFLRQRRLHDPEQIELLGGEHRSRNACMAGLQQLWEALGVVRRLPHTILFIVAAAFYNDGIQTALSMTSVFGSEALRLKPDQLAIAILMVQFIAFVGAIVFGYIANAIGDKVAVLITLVVWIGSIVGIYFVQEYWQFVTIAFVVGLVLGGSQALSRSLFTKMVPKGYESQLFSFYQLSQRGTSWMGPVAYGILTTKYNNNPRPGLLVLAVFLIIGAAFLCFVNQEKARQQAIMYSKDNNQSQLLSSK